jgi:hypothetical protein
VQVPRGKDRLAILPKQRFVTIQFCDLEPQYLILLVQRYATELRQTVMVPFISFRLPHHQITLPKVFATFASKC